MAVDYHELTGLIEQKKKQLADCQGSLQENRERFLSLRTQKHKPVVSLYRGKEIESMLWDKIKNADYIDAVRDIRL